MKEFLFSARLPDGREVCIAPVSADAFQDNGVDSLGDDTGYFIYEYDTAQTSAGIEILGKAASYDAAMRLIDIFIAVQGQRAANHDLAPADALPRSPPARRLPVA